MKYFTILVISFLMVNCKNTGQKTKTETLEIYDAMGTDGAMVQGKLRHFESSEYEGKIKKSTTYYDGNSAIIGKEIYDYIGNDTIPSGSNYYDTQNKLLSYYKYVNDDKGRKIASYAFDAATNELLRVEQFYYSKDNLHSKRIFDANLNPQKRYAFTYDQYGNELSFSVYNAGDSLVVTENFEITSKGSDNLWIEKWGFSNGKPTTKHIKKKS